MDTFILSLQSALATLFAGMTITGIVFLSLFFAVIGVLVTFFFRIYIAYKMALNRHREPLGWVLLSFCFSPILTWVILLIVGDAEQ